MPYESGHARRAALTVLGLSDTATAEQITAAYRRLVKAYHPDVSGRSDPDAGVWLTEIIEAYQHLVPRAEEPTPVSRAGHPFPSPPAHLHGPHFTAAGLTPSRRQPLVAGPVVITALSRTPQTASRRSYEH